MAKLKSIFQGIQEGVHTREVLEEVLALKNVEKVILCSAYVGQLGVEDVSDALASCNASIEAYIGINNGSTSFEGLMSLLQRNVELYTVDTGIPGAIFHPKVFCAFNKHFAKVLVGSSNLTFSGLNNNIECGMLADLDLSDPLDKVFLDSIVFGVSSMREKYPENVVKIHSEEQLRELYIKKLLVTERNTKNKRSSEGEEKEEQAKRMSLALRKPRSKKAEIIPPILEGDDDQAAELKTTEIRQEKSVSAPVSVSVPVHVWTKQNLSDTDAQIPKTAATNPKGCISLTKSGFAGPDGKLINQTKYFRYDVFGDLEWKNNAAKDRQEAFANFELLINGKSKGTRTLMISHKASREADQNNYTTALHVGHFTSDFPSAKGKNLRLYKLTKGQYRIEIA